MAFITRNVSIILLFLILGSMSFLIVSTVYYQGQLSKINSDYETKVNTLKDMEEKADATTKDLNNALKERELRLARGSKFGDAYIKLKDLEETTEARRDRLTQEKTDLQNAIAGSQREFVDAKKLEADVTAQNDALTKQENQLMEAKIRQENLLRSLKAQLDALQQQYEDMKK